MFAFQLDQFFGSDLSGALDLDSLNESHPILQEVASPDEINSLFDTISYSKVRGRRREREGWGRGEREGGRGRVVYILHSFLQGASVIRMLKHYLTEDNFKAGITVSHNNNIVYFHSTKTYMYMYW